ncbi:hypothetical protein HOY82DRAFT_619278 [Tuber indicum]|nr:hypothetical protein HOY82DRAFT_619278 [Tuber indicum]
MTSKNKVQLKHVISNKQEAELWLLPDDFEVFNWCDVKKYLGKNLIIGFVYSQTKILLPPRTNVIHQEPKLFKWIISDQAGYFSEFWTTITTAPKTKGEKTIAGKRISGYSSEDYSRLGKAMKTGWLKAEKRVEAGREVKSGRTKRTRSKTLEGESQQGKQKARKTEQKSKALILMREDDIRMEDSQEEEQEVDKESSEESSEEEEEGSRESYEEYDEGESKETSEEEDKDESDEEYEEKEEGKSDEKDEEEGKENGEDESVEESGEESIEESGVEGEDKNEGEDGEESGEEDGEEDEEGDEEEDEEGGGEGGEEKTEEKSKEGGNQEFQKEEEEEKEEKKEVQRIEGEESTESKEKEVESEVEEREDQEWEKSESPFSTEGGDSGKLVDDLVLDTTSSQSILLKLARGELEHPLQAGKKWKVPTTWPEDITAGSSVDAEVQELKEIENTQNMLSAYKFHLQLKVFLKESQQILISESQYQQLREEMGQAVYDNKILAEEMANLEVKWRKQGEELNNKKNQLEYLENDLKEMEKEKRRLETELEKIVHKEGQLEQLIEKANRMAVTVPHIDVT